MSAAMLFLYAAFSFAYLTLDAGTGALILFGAVQATMILAGFIEGHRPHAWEWVGQRLRWARLPGFSRAQRPGPVSSIVILRGVALAVWGRDYALRISQKTTGG